MKKTIVIIILSLFFSSISFGQVENDKNITAIKTMLNQQAEDWSDGNLEKFMEGYWKSDQLKFVGSSGLTYGWQQTLDNYKKGYPTKEQMGKLTFEILDIVPVGKTHYHVVGKYFLTRTVGNADGIFSLVLKNINNEWKIIIDHSS